MSRASYRRSRERQCIFDFRWDAASAEGPVEATPRNVLNSDPGEHPPQVNGEADHPGLLRGGVVHQYQGGSAVVGPLGGLPEPGPVVGARAMRLNCYD